MPFLWEWSGLNDALLLLLLLQPFLPGWHLTAIHDPGLCNEVSTGSALLLLRVGLLCPLNGGPGLGHPGLGVECYPIGFIPPKRYAIAIPILQDIMRLYEAIVPHGPFGVRWVAEDNGSGWMPYTRSSLEYRRNESVLLPG